MRNVLTPLVGIAVFLVGTAVLQTPADARRGGGVHIDGGGYAAYRGPAGPAYRGTVSRNINRDVSRNVNVNRNVAINRTLNGNLNVNRKYVYRNGKRGYWRNGVWILAPVVAGTTYGYVGTSCNYAYNRWQNTNSIYWRDRYYQCVNGD